MADILTYFEALLPEDVLHDINTEGKTFKVDLVDFEKPDEYVAGADYRKTSLNAAENQQKSPLSPPRIQIEKLDDKAIRLLITVYKSSVDMTESEMQTVIIGSDEMSTQTDSSEWMRSGDTQTSGLEWSDVVGIQTDQSEWLHSETTQTDASSEFYVIGTQTDWKEWLQCADVQTDSSYWQSTVSAQTDIKQLSSVAAQTKEMRIEQTFTDTSVETQHNLATQVNEQVQAVVVTSNAQSQMSVETADSVCQMTPDVTDGTVQTEHHDVQAGVQTDLSIAWRADRETQAVVAVSDSAVQALVPVNVVDCQTESSMAHLRSQDVQASVDLMCSESQTDMAQSHSEAQTEMSMSQQVNSEVQAVVSLTDSATEHSLSHVDAAVPDTSLPTTQDSVLNESFSDFVGNITLPHDTSFQQPIDHSDSSAQTDPVTIIIGDASFLVKKLKNSAGSPSRVTTTGNEIEIELSADAVSEHTNVDYQSALPLPQTEEKENEVIRQQAALLQQQPAMVRTGGVMCRGGGVSGPRFRMPVSQPQPARMTSGLIVRHPTQQVVTAPQLQQQQAVLGPQPVVGGSFSCPFCSLTFIDSPALYEHLSILHTVDQKTKWKQPRGREGKTIVPVKRSGRSPVIAGQGELAAPVLIPVDSFNRSGGGDAHVLAGTSQLSDADKSDQHETELFEDPVEQEVTKKPRGRPPKHSIEGATPAKRQKIMEEDDDGSEDVSVSKSKQRASSAEERQTASGGKRGSRTPRGRRRS